METKCNTNPKEQNREATEIIVHVIKHANFHLNKKLFGQKPLSYLEKLTINKNYIKHQF